jgi:hypothetical protein
MKCRINHLFKKNKIFKLESTEAEDSANGLHFQQELRQIQTNSKLYSGEDAGLLKEDKNSKVHARLLKEDKNSKVHARLLKEDKNRILALN